jgi:deferrochelatase/peroxidase EfeB
MRDRPPLPVSSDPQAFWRYVEKHTRSAPGEVRRFPEPFCAYEGRTVLDLAGPGRAKRLPAPPDAPRVAPDLNDVQANMLRGVRARRAHHLFWRFADADSARALLDELRPIVTSDADRAQRCVTLGLTHDGLRALGVPRRTLDRFPRAFREGPRLRAGQLGDTGRSDPRHWRLGGIGENHRPQTVHAMVSLYTRSDRGFKGAVEALRRLAARHGAEAVAEQPAAALDGGRVHFGYRDGLTNPRFALGPGSDPAGLAPTGDLLLGTGYRSSRGNTFIGGLDPALATHGCYGVLRLIGQDVAAFEGWLDATEPHFSALSDDRDLRRELAAARLMGRWRDGTPLARHPEAPAGRAARDIDAFDYAGGGGEFDDRDGRRCPFGAHIRRTNPRAGMVLGVPWGRRVVRRGMPYGPAWDPKRPDPAVERGLFGLFLCADIESQFEFIVKVWANGGLSAPGLRGTHDPFASGRAEPTPFVFRVREDAPETTVVIPPLVHTRGSLYLFFPGIGGLRWLARAGWTPSAA